MLFPDAGVVAAKVSSAHAGPLHGASHSHTFSVHTPFSEQSASDEQAAADTPRAAKHNRLKAAQNI
jgi:hypothetical protein